MKTIKAILVAIAVMSVAGCIVVPERGPGYYGGHHHGYWRDR
ncbi:MAG: hypothetical protein ABIS45_11180 [Burkholderiales bacterium]